MFGLQIHIHPTMESVYKEIPMECLPREYLPDDYDGPCAGTMDELARKSFNMMPGTHASTWIN